LRTFYARIFRDAMYPSSLFFLSHSLILILPLDQSTSLQLNVKCLLHASGHLITTAPPPPPNHSLEKAYAPGTAKVAEEESSTNSSSDSSSGSDSSSSGGDKDSNSSSAHVSANGASSIPTLPTTLSGEVKRW